MQRFTLVYVHRRLNQVVPLGGQGIAAMPPERKRKGKSDVIFGKLGPRQGHPQLSMGDGPRGNRS